MKYRLVLMMVLLPIFLIGCSHKECAIEGKWKSNEEKTLDSMNSSVTITDEQREFLRNDFFGKLEFDLDCEKFTMYSDGEVTTTYYKSFDINKNTITAHYFDELLETDVESILRLDENGQCYSTPSGNSDFSEYFCRVNNQ